MIAGALVLAPGHAASAAITQKRYYGHDAVEDSHGVIAPWYQGQNGQIDFRVRIAAEFLKRYPWVDIDKSVMAGPHYVFNARVDLAPDGAICFGSGRGPTHAQRMIFGYTRREPYVDCSGNAWLPATEFVVRTGHHTDPVAKTWWTKPATKPISNTPDAELYRYGVQSQRLVVAAERRSTSVRWPETTKCPVSSPHSLSQSQ